MIQRSTLPVLALPLAAVVLSTSAAGAAEGKTAADPNKEAKSGEGAKAEKGEQPAKKDPKAMNADEAEAAGLCPVCKNEHKLIYRVTVGEKAYHFATRDCKKAFEADSNKFIAGAAGAKKEGEPKKMPPEKEAKTEAAGEKVAKTDAAEQAAKTEKAEKTEGGEMMGGDMMGE
ncbi:MAG: hypothetical protein L6R28_17525 [Planctomycetes bacterium]|nr:hypothetical protein [Planctomycetota bacterium]